VSPLSNQFIVEKAVPEFLSTFRETNSVTLRTTILSNLNGLLDATFTVYENQEPENMPVFVLKDDLFEVYSKGFLGSTSEETVYKGTALDGFRKLFRLKRFLMNNEIGIIIQYFNDVVLKDTNEETWYHSNHPN
jgi:DNA repair/transcription protein MET18/MMS19